MRGLRDNPLFYFSCALIAVIALIAIFGGWIKPNGITEPYKIHIREQMVDGQIRYSAAPFAPDSTFPLGTDHRGYDLLSLMLNGLKYTLGYALLLTLFRFLAALPLALWTGATGKGGGFLRYMQWIFSAVPAFLFVYPPLAGIYFGLGLQYGDSAAPEHLRLFTFFFFLMVTFIGIFPLGYQLGERVRYYNEKLYVDVSRLMGATLRHRLIRHVLPNMSRELLFVFLSEFVQILFLFGQLAMFKIMIGGTETLIWDDDGTTKILPRIGEWNSILAYGIEHFRQAPWIILSATTGLFMLILSVQLFLGQLKKRFGSV